jgi:hypothetical protein
MRGVGEGRSVRNSTRSIALEWIILIFSIFIDRGYLRFGALSREMAVSSGLAPHPFFRGTNRFPIDDDTSVALLTNANRLTPPC